MRGLNRLDDDGTFDVGSVGRRGYCRPVFVKLSLLGKMKRLTVPLQHSLSTV